jgi:ribosomal protein S18 acetylase RimI-like enzyme
MSATPDIRMLDAEDAALLTRVADDVFDNPIDPRRAAEFIADPRHHLAVAVLDGRIVGMASAVHYVHPDKPPELWINEVSVAVECRGSGIGRKLLETLFTHGRTLDCKEAWVLTEEENIPARHLYRAVGGEERQVVYFNFRLDDRHGENRNK